VRKPYRAHHKGKAQILTKPHGADSSAANGDTVQSCHGNNVCYKIGVPTSSASAGTGNIYFQISAPDTLQWVALGTGSGMDGSNIFLMYQDGKGNITLSPRAGSPEGSQPTLDTSNTAAKLTLLAGSGVSGGTMTANVVCSNCNTWTDGGTMSLSSTSSGWIGAWKTGKALNTTSKSASISQHDDTATFAVDLTKATISSDSNPFVTSAATNSSGSTGSTGSGSGSDSDSGVVVAAKPSATILAAHGVIMALVMVVLYPLGSLLMPVLSNWKAHAGWQMIAFALMWVGFGLGVQAANERNLVSLSMA
jgi:hypothetical protein